MKDIFCKLPYHKITAPMIPIVVVDIILGKFLLELHKVNVSNGVLDTFPTKSSFNTFLISNIIIMTVYLMLSVFSHIYSEKTKSLTARKQKVK